MAAVAEQRLAGERPERGALIGSLVATALLLGLGWGLVYEYAVKVLAEEWGLRLAAARAGGLEGLRSLVALVFDFLIIIVAVLGTAWVLASFAREAWEAGKWRRYYRTGAQRDIWLPRLTRWQRIQHLWMIATFTVCAVTGFAAHADLGPRAELLTVHVYSGIAMGVLAVLHAAYYAARAVAVKARGGSLRREFPMLEIYSRRFLATVAAVLRGREPPPQGKYDAEQLFEYWGIYWGMLVLGIPGVAMLLWGPDVLGGVLWTMHFKEAVLAVTFILMVHVTYTHFRPSVFPLDPTFITGRMPLRRAREEHPLWAREELEKLQHETGKEEG